jgi:structural maintenance of chromosome 1
MPSLAAGDEDLDEILQACKGHIDRLEVENFKSYAGKQQIGPFKQFTAIIGPNGSGKSNLMDAISFVLGVRTQHLRGSLQELLYSNSDMPAAARPTHGSVTLVYVPEDGQEIHFTRAIQPGGGNNSYQSVYRIDGRQVTLEAYTSRLGSFGILVKIRNFLVFQVGRCSSSSSSSSAVAPEQCW